MKKALSYEISVKDKTTGENQLYHCHSNKLVISNLFFGHRYTWKVTGLDDRNRKTDSSPEMRFSIEEQPTLPDGPVRFREITNDNWKCGTELLFFDYARLVTNHQLQPIWFLPNLPFMRKDAGLRDLKLTAEGTFLAIIDSNAYELSREGKVLWKAPNDGEVSGDGGEDYHHDMQKLPNGNYMVLGNEFEKRKFPGEADSVRFQIGTIIEYAPNGTVVWEWHAADFFTDELLMLRRKADGTVEPATHMNAFTITGNTIYCGFRDASWVLKIDKQTKKVTELYGGIDSGLPNHFGAGLFRYQHDVELLRNGGIAVVNNDSIKDPAVFSSLVVFTRGEYGQDKGELLLRFPFNYDTLTPGKSQKLGNVTELKNGNLLVNMGAINRVFELTPNGKIVWDVLIEQWNEESQLWRAFPHYRVATASSLYPNTFSVKWELHALVDGAPRGELTVFNVGSESNSYTVYRRLTNGELKAVATIPTIPSGESESIMVSLPEFDWHDDRHELLIRTNGKWVWELIFLDF